MIGVGNIGRSFLQLMIQKKETLAQRYGLRLILTAACDSSGAALSPEGLDPAAILALKAQKKGVAVLPGGRPGMAAREVVRLAGAHLLLEISPTNLKDGQPGLGAMEEALARRMHIVTANKGPLVLAYAHLTELARLGGVQLRHSAAVAGACPTVNIGRRDLAGCEISRIEGILNTTTNYILCGMLDAGKSFAEALKEAQTAGIAEADPTLDIDGWDSANKLVILANAVLGVPATLADVAVTGIRALTLEELKRAQGKGAAIKLLAVAEKTDSGYRFSVQPTELPLTHPMSRLTKWQMGIVYYTDIQGTQCAVVDEEGTIPTAAAMLRDLINIYRG
jgi:homoserine dehydrogenase